jgi:mannosyltransferase OCH1-like enzyme
MIPQVIHYCWFGGKPHPKSVRKCIASWKQWMPDYEIKEWNESNFDVDSIPYSRDAYRQGKYAYVSDYARFCILYQYGGLYFDTDVEVVKPFHPIIAHGAFMGIEQDGLTISVAPGLALGVEAGHELYKELIERYQYSSFYKEDGTPQVGLVVRYTTETLLRHGFQLKNEKQQVAGITIYPNEYFNPLEDATGRLRITDNTYSIHWYSKTWAEHYGPLRNWLTRRAHRYFGVDTLGRIKHRFKL